jgi:hypothetical protein
MTRMAETSDGTYTGHKSEAHGIVVEIDAGFEEA